LRIGDWGIERFIDDWAIDASSDSWVIAEWRNRQSPQSPMNHQIAQSLNRQSIANLQSPNRQ
jgi:hypothetical protein